MQEQEQEHLWTKICLGLSNLVSETAERDTSHSKLRTGGYRRTSTDLHRHWYRGKCRIPGTISSWVHRRGDWGFCHHIRSSTAEVSKSINSLNLKWYGTHKKINGSVCDKACYTWGYYFRFRKKDTSIKCCYRLNWWCDSRACLVAVCPVIGKYGRIILRDAFILKTSWADLLVTYGRSGRTVFVGL